MRPDPNVDSRIDQWHKGVVALILLLVGAACFAYLFSFFWKEKPLRQTTDHDHRSGRYISIDTAVRHHTETIELP
jgi:hypothetical protein